MSPTASAKPGSAGSLRGGAGSRLHPALGEHGEPTAGMRAGGGTRWPPRAPRSDGASGAWPPSRVARSQPRPHQSSVAGNEFAGPRSKLPWRSVEASQRGLDRGWRLIPWSVCPSVCPSITFLRAGGVWRPHPAAPIQPGARGLGSDGNSPENPPMPAAPRGRLAPGQGSHEPAGEHRAHRGSPGRARHPRPDARHRRSTGRESYAAGGVEKSRAQPGRAGSASQHLCHAAESQPPAVPAPCPCFVSARIEFVGSQLPANSSAQSGAGSKARRAAGRALERNRCQAPAQRGWHCPAANSSTRRLPRNEPRWEPGHRGPAPPHGCSQRAPRAGSLPTSPPRLSHRGGGPGHPQITASSASGAAPAPRVPPPKTSPHPHVPGCQAPSGTGSAVT